MKMKPCEALLQFTMCDAGCGGHDAAGAGGARPGDARLQPASALRHAGEDDQNSLQNVYLTQHSDNTTQ